MSKFKKGDVVRRIETPKGKQSSGGNSITDTVYEITQPSGYSGKTLGVLFLKVNIATGKKTTESYWSYEYELELVSLRKARGDYLASEASRLEEQAKEMRTKSDQLLRWGSDEEELAALLVEASDSEKPKAERIKSLMGLLKGRIKTDQL